MGRLAVSRPTATLPGQFLGESMSWSSAGGAQPIAISQASAVLGLSSLSPAVLIPPETE